MICCCFDLSACSDCVKSSFRGSDPPEWQIIQSFLYCGSTSSTGHSLSAYGRQAFAVASPTAWNSLSDDLRDPTLSTDSFRRLLKTRLLHRIRGIALYALYKLTTYLLT